MIDYEWCAEETTTVDSAEWDRGEIIDHTHADTLAALLAMISPHEPDPGTAYVVCLIRSDWDEVEGLTDRSYAYVREGGVLDSHFVDALGKRCAAVPKRQAAEAARHRESLATYQHIGLSEAGRP